MKSASEITACVCDSGLFLPLAHRLAERYARVLVWSQDQRSFPSVKQACIGDGFENLERIRDFWPLLDEIDLFVFPDIGQAALQQHLVQIGKPVWGSRGGDVLELNREKFLSVLQEVGLEVPPHKVVVGWTQLRDLLRNERDKYVKISRYRGDMETTHWRSWDEDENWLNWLAVHFGSVKELVRFLVFDKIDTDLEIGCDTYCVDGRWPSLMLNGIEAKDTCYFGAVTQREEMPEQIQDVLNAFGPVLGKYGYRNQFSMEVRVQGDKFYFIDATCRASMPASGSQQLLWDNFPEIIWAGANGELVEPEPTAKFSIEAMVTTKGGKDLWEEVQLDPELARWIRFSSCAYVNGRYCFPPDEFHEQELGWLVATGDTPRETLDRAKELADQLPDGLQANIENMVELIKETETAESEGIPITEEPMPTIKEVVT